MFISFKIGQITGTFSNIIQLFKNPPNSLIPLDMVSQVPAVSFAIFCIMYDFPLLLRSRDVMQFYGGSGLCFHFLVVGGCQLSS